jgi:O-antigen/teichoic acid export membrane protein
MFWAYGSYVGGRLLSLVAMAILARILVPEDFGLVALALTFMAFLDLMQGLGLSEALVIGEESELDERAETAFAINVGLGLVLAVVTAAIAPAAAWFFHEPRLLAVMPVLGLTFVLGGLGATHAGLALRSIDFQSRTIAELAQAAVSGMISVAVAVAGGGVWSLIVGYVFGRAAWTVALWRVVPWRPLLRPKRRHVRSLIRFGGSLTGVAVAAAFMYQFDNIVIGRVLGPAQLGFYSIATRLPMLLILNLAVVAGRVLFPAFAALRERGEMERAVLISLRYTLILTLPLAVFMVVLAEPLTLALFGDRWRPAIGAMQVLCIWAFMTTLGMIWGNMFKAAARPDISLKLAIPQVVALIVGSLVFVREGIVAVAWVQATIAIATQLAVIVIAQHLFGLTVRSVLNEIRPPLLASAGLAAVLLGLRHLISAPWPTIIVAGVVGSAMYLGLLLLLAPDTLKRLRRMAFAAPSASDP